MNVNNLENLKASTIIISRYSSREILLQKIELLEEELKNKDFLLHQRDNKIRELEQKLRIKTSEIDVDFELAKTLEAEEQCLARKSLDKEEELNENPFHVVLIKHVGSNLNNQPSVVQHLASDALNESFDDIEDQLMRMECLNPDEMTYEQLVEMGDNIGHVPKGLKPWEINQIYLKNSSSLSQNRKYENCTICLEGFNNEKVRELPCKHCFHRECADKWLLKSRKCPTCQYEIK